MGPRSVVVVGGGLAGLCAALRCASAVSVHVVEAAARCGGQILTETRDGFLLERGAEGFVFRSHAVPELARSLGFPAEAVIGQSTLRSYGFDGSALRALEPGEAASYLGFQVSREDLGKGIRSLRTGMQSLTDALEATLSRTDGVAVRRSVRASAVERDGQGLRVRLEGAEPLAADAVIVATPARQAATLLERLVPEASALALAPTLSSVTVELAFERAQVEHALDGTGFVVAERAQREGLRACTFTSSKFEGRAPEGRVSLRAFFRPTPDDLDTLDDGAWSGRALRGLSRVIAVRGEPLSACVTRWPDALPVHDDSHKQRVAELEAALARAGLPIALAGSAFHGSGIDAAVQSGERAAQRLLEAHARDTVSG